jgi:hypothetical protein
MNFKYKIQIVNTKKKKVIDIVPMLFMTKLGALDYADKHTYTLKENQQFVIVEVNENEGNN